MKLLFPMLSAVVVLGVAGCGQVEGLADSTSTPLMAASATATDVLLAQNVKIMRKPVCNYVKFGGTDYSCVGSTVSGDAINVSITNGSKPDAKMTITVGKKQIYNGSFTAIQTKFAQVPE